MIHSTARTVRQLTVTFIVAVLALGGGCFAESKVELGIPNPYLGPMRIAVAPALNFSGSTDFDPNAAADIMASELSAAEGVEVIPLSRVLAALARSGETHVESPAHALRLKDELSADAILVFGVTEYDPYEPPVVGIAAQLYGARRGAHVSRIDPVLASRSATPVSQRGLAAADGILGQTSGVYNAADAAVVAAVKEFARSRVGQHSAFGWRKFVVSQQHYLRFCCHTTIKRMLLDGTAPAEPLAAADEIR